MPAFGVIVCPRCRVHAQILELAGTRKTRCQKCGASLEIRKLNMLFSSDSLEEAVSARTALQARVHNLEKEMRSMLETGKDMLAQAPGEPDVDLAKLQDRRQSPKKSPAQVILQLLRSNGGEMGTESLRCLAKEQGIDEQRSDEIIEKLTDAGEIYKPSAGRLCIA
jgi:hypothetical protein